jgi:hypothetical protein
VIQSFIGNESIGNVTPQITVNFPRKLQMYPVYLTANLSSRICTNEILSCRKREREREREREKERLS